MIVTGITAWEVYYWGCLLPGSYDAIFSYTVPDALVTLPSGFLATLVQCIFAERAWRVSGQTHFDMWSVSVSNKRVPAHRPSTGATGSWGSWASSS